MTTATTQTQGQAVKVGDIFVGRWGYGQTNVNFYLVTAVTARTVQVQAMKTIRTQTGHDSYLAEPIEKDGGYLVHGAPIRKHVKRDSVTGEPFLVMETYMYAKPWEGKPVRGTEGH